MAFDWKFKRQPDLTNYIGAQIDPYNASRIASENMQGYKPNAAFTPGTPAEQAAAAMQGYTQNPKGGQFSVPNDMHGGMGQPDLEGYGESLQAASDAVAAGQQAEQEAATKAQRIAEIESEIKELETRIANNTAKLRNFTGNAGQIAAIEARKINAQDPTSIWRWKEGLNQQRINRQEDLERIAKEKKKTEANNLKINRNKIDNILQSTNPTQGWKREKFDMAVKQLNDAEELAKNYNDADSLKKIYERKNELGIYVPVDDEANLIDSEFIREQSMVGKQGGKSKAEFAKYVNDLTTDPKYKHIWTYYPELLQKLYQSIGSNTKNTPKPLAPQE